MLRPLDAASNAALLELQLWLSYLSACDSSAAARIMSKAGESGDRWRGGRKAARWRKVRTPPVSKTDRVTRLVTPGGWIREDSATDSATETKPPVRNALGGRREAKPCAGQFRRRTGKGETVGQEPTAPMATSEAWKTPR